jgi:PPOX class probable F420-dependent enzyme
MVLKHRLADASYWLYDHARHRSAYAAASERGTAPDFSGFENRKYAVLVTFRRDGTPVPTPVWFALLDDRRLVTSTDRRTAKVRRIRRDPRVRVFPSDPRGKPLGPGVEGTAQIVEAEDGGQPAEEALARKYGRTRRIYDGVMTRSEDMLFVEVVPVT